MESGTFLKKDWVLNQSAFKALLACLDPDEERAGQKYENIRHALITFFECRRSLSPEDLADETINRVARRLSEGKQIYAENPASYFYGVAHNVLKEHWERSTKASTSLDELSPPKDPSHDPNRRDEAQLEREQRERQLECLEQCLGGLATKDRELISAYYQGETSVKIKNRKSLAEKLGVPISALRLRALRIRERLEDCVERCMGG